MIKKQVQLVRKESHQKRGSPYEAFFELYKIKSYLTHPNFSLTIVMVNVEEQRLLNGWSEDKKRGSHRYERIPIELVEQIDIDESFQFQKLIPKGIQEPFSTNSYREVTKLSIGGARTALHVLNYVGVIEKVGKKGNLVLYQLVKDERKK